MTYLTKEDWTNYLVPKISDDKSFSDTIRENIHIQNNFIVLINKILNSQKISHKNLSQRILISSMIYYHKYALFNNISYYNLSLFDKLVIYCACIFISFKEANKLIDINNISLKVQSYFNKIKHFEIEEIIKYIIDKEYEILVSMELNMSVDWSSKYVQSLILYLKKMEKREETIKNVVNCINLYLNFSILFPLCLYYNPCDIFFGCILLAKKNNNFDFININDLIKMSKIHIDTNNVEECSLYITKIINYKNKLINENKSNNSNIEYGSNKFSEKENDKINLKNILLINSNTNNNKE